MSKPRDLEDISTVPTAGRILAIDPGTKKIGVAVCDDSRTLARPLPIVRRESWKKLVGKLAEIIAEFDAQALVVGLPLNFDGSESEMSAAARKMADNMDLSFQVPVFLQDERATTYEARGRLWNAALSAREPDSEAAVIILTDFLDRLANKS